MRPHKAHSNGTATVYESPFPAARPATAWAMSVGWDTTAEGYLVCRPRGDLDSYSVGAFRQAVADMASSPHVIVDLSEVTFVDSAGLGALVGGIRRIRETGGQVAVAANRPVLLRLLRTTGFDRIVTVAPTAEAAAVALTAGGAVLTPPPGR